MEVNKKQLADIFGASIRTIQNWQEQGMPVLRGGGKGNEVLYDSAAVIRWYAERDAEIENENHGPSGPLFLCGGVHDER
ncbi:phage DNA packaging Nu1 family protein [Escherichia coli 5-366-08_S4_C1]|nr:terminase small subunit [Escherichia coli]KEO36394.1 phage DNA packaging Nu1 family protein [Escherichia coli 5-366-08_S4_C1]